MADATRDWWSRECTREIDSGRSHSNRGSNRDRPGWPECSARSGPQKSSFFPEEISCLDYKSILTVNTVGDIDYMAAEKRLYEL